MHKITVTGTKGKTTAVAIIADVLQNLGLNVLKVDTTGHFVNGERRSTLEESKEIWGLVPSVNPGRYLWEFRTDPVLQKDGVAVLESSLGSSAIPGLGYRYHDVGVFLNVFEDHIGSSHRIQAKSDIADAKDYVFGRLEPNQSYAVFNADDELVCGKLHLVEEQGAKKVPFGRTFDQFDITSHLAEGGVAFTVNEAKELILRTENADTVVADLKLIPWTFNGTFEPSIWNLLAATAAIYGYYDGKLPGGFRSVLEAVRLDPYGGRLTLLKNTNDVTILADYAHEKVSLCMVGDLARQLVAADGKVIGVVRLAHDRTDELIQETGQAIALHFDQFVVYDKIDGHFRKGKNARRFPQIEGRTSQILADAIQEVNPKVERIVREDEALHRAAELAKPGDVAVHIVNDDIKQSIEFIKQSFQAEFI